MRPCANKFYDVRCAKHLCCFRARAQPPAGGVVETIDRSQVRAIFESRAAIEATTARLAARHADEAELDTLVRLIEAMERACGNPDPCRLEQSEYAVPQADCRGIEKYRAGAVPRTDAVPYWMLRVPILFSEPEMKETNTQHRTIFDALGPRPSRWCNFVSGRHDQAALDVI